MSNIIIFPMSLDMVRRVNQNKSYERALDAAMTLQEAEEAFQESELLRKKAEKFHLDVKKLFKRKE